MGPPGAGLCLLPREQGLEVPSPRASEAPSLQNPGGEGLAELRPRPGPWATGTRVQALPAADRALLALPKRRGAGVGVRGP